MVHSPTVSGKIFGFALLGDMARNIKDKHQKKKRPYPSPSKETNKQKQKAEEREVAGRHKNDGQ